MIVNPCPRRDCQGSIINGVCTLCTRSTDSPLALLQWLTPSRQKQHDREGVHLPRSLPEMEEEIADRACANCGAPLPPGSGGWQVDA